MMDLEPVRVLLRQNRVAEAEQLCKSLINADRGEAAAWHLLGVILHRAGDVDGAGRSAANAIALSPTVAEFHITLGVILAGIGRHEQAIAKFRHALSLRRDYPEAANNAGVSLSALGRLEEAADAFRQAIALNPGYAEAHSNLGDALRRQGRFADATAELQEAIRLKPELPSAHGNLATAYQEIGRIDEAVTCIRRRLELQPDSPRVNSELLYLLHYSDTMPAQDVYQEHVSWGRAQLAGAGCAPIVHDNARSPGRRLKLGYISPDFREHPVARFLEPVLREHDRGQFEVYCYSDVSRPDEVTARFEKSAEVWRQICGLSDEQVAALIRRDRIDILIDTTGHMQRNRVMVFARKPAPIQILTSHYPGSSGLAAMDYFLTDELVDPPGLTEHLYTEKLVRVGPIGRCYLPDENSPETVPLPADAAGGITFGGFNRLSKVTDAMLGNWAKIVAGVPGSRLQVLVEGSGGEQTCPSIRQRFARFGLTAEKMKFIGRQPRWQYLQTLAATDICLDTFPYNGCTTTCDSLWMGTPVVTLAGKTHVSRVSFSFLSQAGLADLSADSPEEYVQTAVTLANDRDRLRRIRCGLRERMRTSPLTNAGEFTKRFEAQLRKIWSGTLNS